MSDTTPLLDIAELRIRFPTIDGGWSEAVRGVSLQLARHERLGIVGESGSGKSLTGRAVLGLLPRQAQWSARRLAFAGQALSALAPRQWRALRGRHMAMILQDPKYSLNPVLSVGQQLAEAFRQRDPGLSRRALRKQVLAALAAVRIRDPQRVAGAYPHELSGGMGQRVMIAMMVASGPELLIADEPTSALDVTVQLQVLAILDDLVRAQGTGLIFISHDLHLVASFCDRVLVMYAGRVLEECAAGELHQARHPYTRGLLAAAPDLERPQLELPVLSRDARWREDP
ncbi:MAG TPA: ABC transporter ATP-binding protein [Candidatus Competibacteraceae bacterium]|nr:ABC transporter ATP-binding protein [Candidatus Competibacteraceae bacterium]